MPFEEYVSKAFCENDEVMMTFHGKVQPLDDETKGLVDSINSAGGELIYHVIVDEINGLRIFYMFIVSIDADDWKNERYKHDQKPIRMMLDIPLVIDYEYVNRYIRFYKYVPFLVNQK